MTVCCDAELGGVKTDAGLVLNTSPSRRMETDILWEKIMFLKNYVFKKLDCPSDL
jgi:hypothetical protein